MADVKKKRQKTCYITINHHYLLNQVHVDGIHDKKTRKNQIIFEIEMNRIEFKPLTSSILFFDVDLNFNHKKTNTNPQKTHLLTLMFSASQRTNFGGYISSDRWKGFNFLGFAATTSCGI